MQHDSQYYDLEMFLNSGFKTAWVREPGIDAYVSRSRHLVLGSYKKTLDIKAVSIHRARSRAFMKFMHKLFGVEINRVDGLCMENVIENWFSIWLAYLGFVDIGGERFYLPKDDFAKAKKALRFVEMKVVK